MEGNFDILAYLSENDDRYAGEMTFGPSFAYWFDYLFEKLIRIFEWKGLPFEQIALELPTMTAGFSGFVDDPKGGMISARGSLSGPTWSPMIFKNFTYAAVGCEGGTKTIYSPYTAVGRLGNCVLIQNNSMRNSIIPLVDRYASMLAHEDINIVNSGVNMRYDAYFSADTDGKVESIKAWRKKIFKGIFAPIVDRGVNNAPSVIPGSSQNKGQTHKDAIESRQEILRMFFAEVGVRMSREKKGNLIAAEVQQDDQMLLFNISDMLKQRQKAAEEISVLFKLDVSVKLSEEYAPITAEETEENADDFDGDI